MIARNFRQAGDFDKRVIWQRQIETADGCGGYTSQWVSKGAVWVHIVPVSVEVQFNAESAQQKTTHTVWLRAASRPNDRQKRGDQFVFGSRYLLIHTVHDPDETGRYLKCEVTEKS